VQGGNVQGVAAVDPHLVAAHRALLNDPSVQFDILPSAPEPKLPGWLHGLGRWVANLLRPVGRLLRWLISLLPDAPYARILLWSGVLGFAAVALVWLLIRRLRTGSWPSFRRKVPRASADEEAEWNPDTAPARAWLREADALAERGSYAEAAHHLLYRSIEDIAHRRPRLIRPALTSRDIAAADAIPLRARTVFAAIAAVVERSLFGGHAVGLEDWTACRTAYADFALPKAWSA
jgi:hypothetical protein